MNRPENSSGPPQWAVRFLEWYCDPHLVEDLQGDLLELYERKRKTSGLSGAKWLYIWLVLRSFRWSAFKRSQANKNNIMILTGQNIKIAGRVLWRDRFNTMLNITGLTIGIICFVILGLYVRQELSYDHFHSRKDRIYRVWLYEDYGDDKIFFNSVTPIRFESFFEENFPELEEVVQYQLRNFPVQRAQRETISEPVAIISPELFEVFDFNLISGNTTQPFNNRYNLIISGTYAQKYFGSEDPVGKVLNLQFGEDITPFTVSAIMEDIPSTSSVQFDLAISNVHNRELFGERAMTAWLSVAPETYVLVKENASIHAVEAKTQDVIMQYRTEEVRRDEYTVGFQPLTDIHLNTEIPVGIAPVSNPVYVYVLAVIAFLVLLIACINYTTLSVGQSIKRAKEVGMRKVLGAGKAALVYKYLTESLLVAFISMLVGTVLAILLIPAFNHLTDVQLVYGFEWWHLAGFLGIALLIGICSGIYPSLVLTSTGVSSMLRSGSSSGGKHWVRKAMVTFQFVVTVLLISSALIMSKQLNYLQNKDLGYEHEAFVAVPMFSESGTGQLLQRVYSAMRNAELLKPRLENHPEISNITMASHVFGSSGWANLAFTDDQGIFRRFRLLGTDSEYLQAFDIPVVEGRGFEKGNGLDERQSIIINEAAVSYFGLEDPIGKTLPSSNFGEHRIIGVVKDFHYSSLHNKIEPLVIAQNVLPIYQGISDGDLEDSVLPKVLFKYKGSQLTNVQEILETEWKSLFPSRSLDYFFVDENIARQYVNEARLNKLVSVATAVSVLIASIGLLGLTVLVVNSREKEIGIRKVIGASPFQIFGLLAKTFSWQLLAGICLAVPLTIWLMQKWLEDFAYRVRIGADMFVLSTLISIVVALLVISFHSWKAAVTNPVKSLRTE